jgi:beta-lactamase regulating signal transducer with metallopeptidase domain
MTSPIFSMHYFLMINAAIAASYVFSRGIIQLPFIRKRLAQHQRLLFARGCLAFAIVSFLLAPYMSAIKPLHHVNIEIEPVLMHASSSFLRHHEIVAAQVASVATMPLYVSFNTILVALWFAGFCVYMARYLRMLQTLKNLRDDSFCAHSIRRIHILFSERVEVPFCWSFLLSHYIALPESYACSQDKDRLAIRHELQHIRQGDTYWLHALSIIKLFCYWNPFVKLWSAWLNELQEFSCDEMLILRRKASPTVYAQCLLDNASSQIMATGVIGINGTSTSILYRRVNMLFSYKNQKTKLALIAAYGAGFLAITSAAFAFNNNSSTSLSASDVRAMIKYSHLKSSLQITAAPEVVSYLNEIRANPEKKQKMLASLERMKKYQPGIQLALKRNAMPDDLLALPLVESGYRPLPEHVNPVKAAGVWQIIPSTAADLGLVINASRDDRMNIELATTAALTLLQSLHEQYHDWKLAVVAYEIGDKETSRLINATGSHDAWIIARSAAVPDKYKTELKKYLAMFDASVILIHNPSILNG